uniref:C2H2-type domain-containing protein n=1 Tax=Physcomitrium patens TaxID=3218 RepID=A0A2K1JPJ4_PHYPA|nr:hypothetical protein PHYPA_015843 [Physcomitrium patens]
MDRLDEASGGADLAVQGENCLKQIASNYVEEEDGENCSGEEEGVGRENGADSAAPGGHGGGGRHGLGESVGVEVRDSAGHSGNESERREASGESCDEEQGGGSSGEEEEEDGDDEEEGEEGEQRHGGASVAENGFANLDERDEGKAANSESYSGGVEGLAVERENTDSAEGTRDRVDAAEKSVTQSECDPEGGGVQGGPTLRRKRGRPLKSSERQTSIRAGPITPKLEEPRSVRINRGVKRRYPGDESEDDSLPKRVRVRSITNICGDFAQPIKGEDMSVEEAVEANPARKRGRPRRGNRVEGVAKADEAEVSAVPSSGKRKTIEAVLDSESMKWACHGRNAGPIFACNAEGCKKRFVEAASLYAHARVHGDRPYVCHYDGCIKSFSERSKLKRHFLIHTGEKPFLCVYEGCGKAFSLDFNLRSHMKTHTGDYHECPYDGCDKRYCQEYKLRAHIVKEHNKSGKGTKKLAKVVGNGGGVAGANVRDAAAAKKRAVVAALQAKRSKLESMKEARESRIAELEEEKEREAFELSRIERLLKKVEGEQRRVEGQGGSPAMSVSASEEEEEEEEGEEGEGACPSNGTGGDTSSSDEQQSRLEYTAMGEGKDVVMFAHKLPTAHQAARLVRKGKPGGFVGKSGGPGFTPNFVAARGSAVSKGVLGEGSWKKVERLSRGCGASPCGGGKVKSGQQEKRANGEAWSQGESSVSGAGKANGGVGGKGGGGQAEGGSGKARVVGTKKSGASTGRGGARRTNASTGTNEKGVRVSGGAEMARMDGKGAKEVGTVSTQQQQQGGGRESTSGAFLVSMNPILVSSDHGFSPTDARFLANEGFPSLAQGLLRERLQAKDGVKSMSGSACPPKEKAYRSMNEVLHSAAEAGFVGGGGGSEEFGGEQAAPEQSFEPSAAQLFTYHEQPRLVD